MIPDLQPIFAEYEKLRASCDAVFERIRHDHAQCATESADCGQENVRAVWLQSS